MRWGKLAIVGLAAMVGLALGLIVAQPWQGPTPVDAVELADDDEARREEDADGGEVRDDVGDDDDPTGTGGDTRGTGTNDGAGAGTDTGGSAPAPSADSNTNAGGGSASVGSDT